MAEFIYTMTKARKAVGRQGHPRRRHDVVLPGAKIGVVGPNGAGKSTILKIMAGLDQPSNGEAWLSPGYTVGILRQEPQLDDAKTVLGNIQRASGEINAKLDRYNEISAEMAEPDCRLRRAPGGNGQAAARRLDHADAWDLDTQLEQAMDALRCPPPRRRRVRPVRR